MRLHLFDPQLGAADGHYLAYDSLIAGEFERRGIATCLYGAANPRGKLTASFPIEPVFAREIHAEASQDPQIWALENYSVLNEAFEAELMALGAERFDSGDLAFFPSILQNQIDGVRRWVMALPPARRPALVIRISVLSHLMPYLQNRQNAEHPRTIICAETEELTAQVRQIAEVPVTLVPLPLAIEGEARSAGAGERLVCAYLGHASPLKGFDLLPGLVAAFGGSPNAPQFVVQIYPNDASTAAIEQALASAPGNAVRLVRGPLAREDYLILLEEADIMLLPYVTQFYGWASSGILVEALSLGKVIVAPEDSWLARQAQRHNAGYRTFCEHTPVALAGALRQAISDYPALSRKAIAAAPLFRAAHSPARFVDVLLGAVPPGGA